MATPFAGDGRPERRRDWIAEAYVLTTVAHIPDPLGLPVAEFNGFIRMAARGDARRVAQVDPRAYVESVAQGGHR